MLAAEAKREVVGVHDHLHQPLFGSVDRGRDEVDEGFGGSHDGVTIKGPGEGQRQATTTGPPCGKGIPSPPSPRANQMHPCCTSCSVCRQAARTARLP